MFIKTYYRLMQVKSIAECSKHSAILSTFIKLPVVIKTYVLSIFEWPFYTGFTVQQYMYIVPYHEVFFENRARGPLLDWRFYSTKPKYVDCIIFILDDSNDLFSFI